MTVIKKCLYSLFFCLIFTLDSFAGSANNTNKKFYAERYKFVKEYIALLKKQRKKNKRTFGSLAETIDGGMFVAFERSQVAADKKALEACKKNKGIKCKVRFQSLSINKNYNRYAVYNDLNKTLEGSNYITRVGHIVKSRGVTFLSNAQNLTTDEFLCSQDKERDRGITSIFINELKKYPSDFIENSGLKFIVICGEIKLGNKTPYGIAPAHYDKSLGVFFVSSDNIKRAIKQKRSKIVKHVFHHEYYHIIDSELAFNIYDEEWVRLNKYPYNKDFEPSNAKLLNDKKGFITNYAMNNEFEDKAELFANLVNDYDAVKERIKHDKILFAKTKLLIERLKKISPKINKSFWDKLS